MLLNDLFHQVGMILKEISDSTEYLLDSFPVPICDNIRIFQVRLIPDRRIQSVSELWRYDEGVLNIYQLQAGEYVECSHSPTFTQLPLIEIPRFLEETQRIGVMGMTRNFRHWVREQISVIN